MPTAVTGEALSRAVETQTFIKGGDPSCAEGLKYDFRMGTRILKASFGQPIDMTNIPEAERGGMSVDPGEVVFVLTEERLSLPENMMAELSPKRKLSHDGVMVLGGFCIDPLYQGRLLVGLYNFSSTPFPLRPGKKLIAAIFYQLGPSEVGQFRAPEAAIEDFPDDLIRLIRGYKPIALAGLQEALVETQRELAELRTELTSGREWQRQFRDSLQAHNTQIEKLLESLKEEKDNRLTAQRDFDDRLRDLQKDVYSLATKLGAIIGGIVLIAGFIAQFVFPKLFGP